MTTRLVLADDDALIRAGLAVVLRTAPDLSVVAEAADGLEVVEVCRKHEPDLVLMDVRMPGIDGVEAARRIASGASGRTAVVLMSADAHVLTPASLSGRAVSLLRKERLGPRSLRAIWDAWTAGRRS